MTTWTVQSCLVLVTLSVSDILSQSTMINHVKLIICIICLRCFLQFTVPGYLIAFCARLDEAKLIVGKHTKKEIDYPKTWYQRYFFRIMVAYGIGLALAFTAFCITGVGQPALLYLVPCCLGMMLIIGRKEIRDLWSGSRAIKLATKLKTQCERAWGKEKMRRQVEKAKRERGENGEHQPYRPSRSGFRDPEPSDQRGREAPGGRGNGGRGGRGGRVPGRGRGLETGRSSKRSNSTRDAARASSSQRPADKSAPRKDSSRSRSPVKSKSKVGVPPGSSPASPRRRYTATLEGSPSPKKGSSKKLGARSSLPIKPDLDIENPPNGPKNNDICFGDTKCTGTKHLRTIVKHELKSDPQADFSPTILNRVLQRLDGRTFFLSDGNGGWKVASKNEITKEIAKVYHTEKSKLEEKQSRSKGNGDENDET